MKNRDLLGGLLLVAIGVFFGVQSLRYKLGTWDEIGPGLFPLGVSCIVVVLGAINTLRALLVPGVAPTFNLKGIACVVGAIAAFVLLSRYVDMIAGIVALVVIASIAADRFSPVKIGGLAIGLIAIAFVFQHYFQLNLPLY